MSNVFVLGFEELEGAENMLANVQTWEEKGWLKVEDAAIVTRPTASGDVEIKQTTKKTGKYALGGGGIGFLAGMLLGGPIGGVVVGSAVGAIAGALKDSGIDDKFIRQVSETLKPGGSQLFLMTAGGGNAEALAAELEGHRATVVSMNTSLPPEDEKRLRDLLSGA
jgi:uncharacterized membrane protein